MLHRLPNELLVMILTKTTKETARKCRLLNFRFDKIITRYDLHKEDAEELTICRSLIKDELEKIIRCKIKINGREQCKTFENYEELLDKLPYFIKKIGNLTTLRLISIEINAELLQVILEEKCFLKIRELFIDFSKIDINIKDDWLAFLNKLHLNILSFINWNTDLTAVPDMMILRVKTIFHYSRMERDNIIWFDDNILENWFSAGKRLHIPKCQTSLTIKGIIRCIQIQDFELRQVFGIIKDTNQQHIENALKDVGIQWKKDTLDDTTYYWLKKIGDRKLEVEFTCIKPQNQEDMN